MKFYLTIIMVNLSIFGGFALAVFASSQLDAGPAYVFTIGQFSTALAFLIKDRHDKEKQ